jgi:hypothetical protein
MPRPLVPRLAAVACAGRDAGIVRLKEKPFFKLRGKSPETSYLFMARNISRIACHEPNEQPFTVRRRGVPPRCLMALRGLSGGKKRRDAASTITGPGTLTLNDREPDRNRTFRGLSGEKSAPTVTATTA